MDLNIVLIIFRKEIRDTFRDRRALVAMLGIPLLLYPALFLSVSQVAILHTTNVDKGWSRVGIVGDDTRLVRTWVEIIPKVELVNLPDPRSALAKGDLDLVVVVEPDARRRLQEGGTVEITLEYDATETASQRATSRVLEGLTREKGRLLQMRLAEAKIAPEFIVPLSVTKKNVASSTKVAGSVLGMIIPIIMVLMVGVGAFYPAVDLTAGEKERGTFETLLSTPVARLDIVAGKFLAVFCLAMMTALLNLGSMTTTFAFQMSQLPAELQSSFAFRLPPLTVLLMALFLVPLAFFISAVMMSLAVFARSFREAQSYVTPFFLVILFPAAVAGIPGIGLNAGTQFLPITNIALLFKEMMKGDVSVDLAFGVLMSTMAYALLAIVVATWIFQREELMLPDSHGTTVPLRRAYLLPREVPPASVALLVFSISLLLIFYLGTFLQMRFPVVGILATQWLFLLVPALFTVWYIKSDFIATFHLHRPSWLEMIATVFLVFGWIVIQLQLNIWINRVFPVPTEIEQDMEWALERVVSTLGVGGLYFAAAVSPALCEEALFRGILLSALRKHLRGTSAILVVAALFGTLHLNVYRLPATFMSGVMLTYVVWRTNSIFLGCIGHFTLNTLLLWLHRGPMPSSFYPVLVQPLEAGENLPTSLLFAACLSAVLGVLLLEWEFPKRKGT